ncbi:hypothetical protein T05_646 [Trichinella murrelli]|uniref:Uncharacterized protein n=1 Tax=Trichinella murrelli TaxID=144512 RepID=A0A0V0SVC3_9BILA|nr:hypothetical protein T05_646 [Trichinella murrelli]
MPKVLFRLSDIVLMKPTDSQLKLEVVIAEY